MLSLARIRTAGQPVGLVRADAARLPFPAASFDAALAVTSLCFVVDPLPALREVAGVLRPGERLVLGELNRWSLWALVRRVEGLLRPITYRAARFRDIRELRRLLMVAGFRLVGWEGIFHLQPLNHAGFLAAREPVERCAQGRTPALGAFLAVKAHRAAPRPMPRSSKGGRRWGNFASPFT